ncbi:MAG: tRNA (5-methylaminomethyl-2-thiouridine)(34)-methyltransferase MnmD [Prevotellaceae bacterium]|nr:tRNA (5-methylaminomethyl-2-thiouridine)(34)-methyltransferase MnmD [Prevotellaceae bacterium]
MERRIIITDDGSPTFFVPELNECYHSTRGAVSESLHVFIDAGLREVSSRRSAVGSSGVRILEVGFGTGLNALLAMLYAEEHKMTIYYESLEKYPLSEEEAAILNYSNKDKLAVLHACAWEEPVQLTTGFTLCKRRIDVLAYKLDKAFDLIYFDAFAPAVQPDLWSKELFAKLCAAMSPDGVLVTYSAKGTVKSALRAAGFEVQRLPGAAGKRHMIRAIKN